MRVHELAKELGSTSKELLGRLEQMGVSVKNHMSAITQEQVEAVKAAALPEAASSVAVATEESAPPPQPPPPPEPVAPPTPPPAEEETAATPEPAEEADEPSGGVITVRGPIIVKEFAPQLGLRPNQLIAELMAMNVFASINERIDLRIARPLAEKHGFTLEQEKKTTEHKAIIHKEKEKAEPDEDKPEDLTPRPPVVAFLGHVDHGKTSLLDRIRATRVASGEDGGITQHIGAYTVEVRDQMVTFLDTPGHEAFTAMRARGANLTDIVVIIIAADDGLMPQTREAIQHARAADVAIMVAINKIDLPGANVDRVMQQLQQEDLAPEAWGGEIVCQPVSAETGEGVNELLEMIALQAEVMELTANRNRSAQGYAIEARLEPGMGPTATILVRRGTLHVGDAMTCGPAWGRVKALINDAGVKVRTAGPSVAVKCLGLTQVPEAGSEFRVVANDREAKQTSDGVLAEQRSQTLTTPKRASLEDLLQGTAGPEKQKLAVILKTDVQGSLEAIADSLNAIESDKVSIDFILQGVGNITGNDVLLASASNAIIIGFHVSKDGAASATAKHEGVQIRLYSVIYELIDDIREAMTGLLAPESREKILGHAEIRQVFDVSKSGRIAGCMVTDGHVTSRAKARVRRADDTIYEGTVDSLRRFQNEAASVRDGQECGIRLDNFAAFEEHDTIEFYELEEVAQKL